MESRAVYLSSRQATPGSSAQVPDLSLPRWRESSILSLCLCSRRGTAIPGSKRPVNRAAPFSRLASSATGGASPGNSPHATRGKAAGLARGSRRRSCPAPKSYLSSRQATPGSSLPSRNSREARPSRAPLCRVPIDFTSRLGAPDGAARLRSRGSACTTFIYPAGRPRRAAPCPPGTPERRRRRWRCGSSCWHSPAGPRRPRSRRRPRW